jgi:hypothetical protein
MPLKRLVVAIVDPDRVYAEDSSAQECLPGNSPAHEAGLGCDKVSLYKKRR